MAHLTREELGRAVYLLAEDMGLARLHERLVRLHGLVTRRRPGSVEQFAARLHTLTSGLRRPGPAAAAFQAVWAEALSERIDKEAEEELEKLAEEVNACLDERGRVRQDRSEDLDDRLRRYESRLAALVGAERARLDTLMKAYPEVAERLRAMPPANPESSAEPAGSEEPESGGAPNAGDA